MPEEIFFQAVRVCSWIIVWFCFLGGFGLLVVPKFMVKLNRVLNRSFPTDALQKVLERPIDGDKWVVGHRIVVGVIGLLISIIIFVQLMVG